MHQGNVNNQEEMSRKVRSMGWNKRRKQDEGQKQAKRKGRRSCKNRRRDRRKGIRRDKIKQEME